MVFTIKYGKNLKTNPVNQAIIDLQWAGTTWNKPGKSETVQAHVPKKIVGGIRPLGTFLGHTCIISSI